MTVCLRATARRRARQQRGASSTCGQSAALSSARQNTGMPGDQVPLGGVAEKALEGVDDLGGLLELGFVCRVGTWRRITPVRTRVGVLSYLCGGELPGLCARGGILSRARARTLAGDRPQTAGQGSGPGGTPHAGTLLPAEQRIAALTGFLLVSPSPSYRPRCLGNHDLSKIQPLPHRGLW